MARDLEDAIQQKVRALPVEQQEKVLAFVESLAEKSTPLKRLGQLIDERLKDVPQEVIDGLPTDASENLDHYLYGAPKK